MNNIYQSSYFCRKFSALGRIFNHSRTRKILSWRFYELHFFSKPLIETQNYSGGSLLLKSLKGSFIFNRLQLIFEEEKRQNDEK